MRPLPAPTLDHVVINVRDRLDEAAALYRRLGFHLTPRGYHTLGSMNHLAIFGTDYLELIAVPPGKSDRNDILGFPFGLNGLVFGTEDSDALFARLSEAGVPVLPPNDFSRPVEYEGGTGDAAFRTVRVAPGVVPAGRLYFCEHLTRRLVWRDEWRRHANGVVGVVRATIVSTNPATLAGLFAQMFGAESVQPIPGGARLVVGLSSFDIVDLAECVRRYGAAAPDAEGRDDFMACLTFRTSSFDQTVAALTEGGVAFVREAGRIVVPAAGAFNAMLEFIA